MKYLIIAAALLAAVPAHATPWTATFECEHNKLASVTVHKGIISWGMDEEAVLDKGTINRVFKWDPDNDGELSINGKACRKLTDEEVDKLNTQMEKEIRGDGDGDK